MDATAPKPFFLKVNDLMADRMPDINTETPDSFATLDEAVAAGKEQVDGHMGECSIYACHPVAQVLYGRPRVVKAKESA